MSEGIPFGPTSPSKDSIRAFHSERLAGMSLPINFHDASGRERVVAEELLALGAKGDFNFEFLVLIPSAAVVNLAAPPDTGASR